jgi:DNA-binding winged helix-turn-helix (wHTH) protein
MTTNTRAETALCGEHPPRHRADPLGWAAAEEAVEFGRFHVLLRRRRLLADGVPIELGTRAFDLLLVLVEADGLLMSKGELMARVWPGVFVSEENLKVQILALRKALGEDRDFIRTEFGRGYRFIAPVRSIAQTACRRPMQRQSRRGSGVASISRRPLHRRSAQHPPLFLSPASTGGLGRGSIDPAHG